MKRVIADVVVALLGLAFIGEDMLNGLAGDPPTWRILVGLGLLALAFLPWPTNDDPAVPETTGAQGNVSGISDVTGRRRGTGANLRRDR